MYVWWVPASPRETPKKRPKAKKRPCDLDPQIIR